MQTSRPIQLAPALAGGNSDFEKRAKYVANLRANGKVHKLAHRKGFTLYNWAWRNSPLNKLCESAMGPPGDAIPFCTCCMKKDSNLSSGESSFEEDEGHQGPWPADSEDDPGE